MIEDVTITEDERRCLRMWFRHAIVELERQEVTATIVAERTADETPGKHRTHAVRRKGRRDRMIPHLRELVF